MIISVHGFWFGIGAISSALVCYWLERHTNKGLKPYQSFEDIAFILFIGLIGSRSAYVLFYEVGGNFWNYISFWQVGLISFGGIITGSVAIFILAKWRRYKALTVDNLALSLLVGWALGRLGNFLMKDAYGVTDQHFSGLFYNRVPIQLYEMMGLLLLFAFSFIFKRYQDKSGWGFWYMISGYGVLRFTVDFWRDLPSVLGPFNISQVFAFTMFICGMIGMLIWRKRKTA